MSGGRRRIPLWAEIAGWCILIALSAGRLVSLGEIDVIDAAILAISVPMLVAAVAGGLRRPGEPDSQPPR